MMTETYLKCRITILILPTYTNSFDVLLMNLPHNTLEHLPHLLPLLTKHGPRLVRGWAVVKEEDLTLHDKKLNTILSSYEDLNEEIKSSIRKQYNSTMVLTGFEARFGKW